MLTFVVKLLKRCYIMHKKVVSLLISTIIINSCLPYVNGHNINDYVMFRINKTVEDKSRFLTDGMTRKSKNKRIEDNIKWYKRYGHVNIYYNIYGLDIEGFRDQDDFISDSEIKESDNNILNKFEFYQKIRGIGSKFLPKLYIACENNIILYPKGTNEAARTILNKIPNGKYISKPILSNFGKGIYLIDKNKQSISIKESNGRSNNFEKYNPKDSLIQEYVEQHDDLSKLNSSSLNCIKMISINQGDEIKILSAALKIGTNGKAIVDSLHQGGTCVGINIDNGKLLTYGTYIINRAAERKHPISNIEYKDYQVPYWEEAIEMIKTLHKKLPEFKYISWNIGISKTGPIIIGMNDSCHIAILQMANGGLRHKLNYLK